MYTGTLPPCRTRSRSSIDSLSRKCFALAISSTGGRRLLDAGGEIFDAPKLLDPTAVAFIDALPSTWERTIADVRLAVTHASPGNDQRGIHPDREAEVGAILASAAADVLVVGHTHVPMNLAGAILASAAADVLVVGHTHVPMNLAGPQGSIVNPGSILRQSPVTERLRASGTFGVLELPSRRFTVHRTSDGAEIRPTLLPATHGGATHQ